MELTRAKQLALEIVDPKGIERVGLEDGLGRVLGETLFAPFHIPRESRSRLDGYALRNGDTLEASPRVPAILKVVPGLLAAGHVAPVPIGSGQCARILTGAPLPQGADVVVPQENIFREEDHIVLNRPQAAGSGVTCPGEDIRQGDPVVLQGEVLTPTRLALIAALGFGIVPVYRKPSVALLATGDEVRELGEPLHGPYTVCNNRLLLGWLVQLHGGDPIHAGVALDDAEAIAERLRRLETDAIITTGGIGRGDRDFVLDAWERLGVKVIFRTIGLSPGHGTALGVRGRQVLWAFPGNPWAGQIVFEELVVPTLRRFLGLNDTREPLISARLESSIRKKPGLCKAVRGMLNVHAIPPCFTPSSRKEPTLFAALRMNLAYTILEASAEEVPKGSQVKVRLCDFPLLASPMFEGTSLDEHDSMAC